MTKKLAALAAALFLVTIGTAACRDKNVQQENQSGPSNQPNPYTYEDMSEEEYERELQRMQDEGILDENGQPAPGVDLNDYPGLG